MTLLCFIIFNQKDIIFCSTIHSGIKMFTGLIEEVGEVISSTRIGGGLRIKVRAEKIMDDLKIDDSVAMNGVCQTVVSRTNNSFDVEAVEETLRKTTLGKLRQGEKLNLERAAALGDRMGGHLVQGHVDCVGYILSVKPESTGRLVWVSFPDKFSKYVVAQGSICIHGISLTVAKVESSKFMVSIIPHTWNVTVLKDMKPGSEVNLEFDIIGKYVENMVSPHINTKSALDQYKDQPEW
jgi:riboflavin synthase